MISLLVVIGICILLVYIAIRDRYGNRIVLPQGIKLLPYVEGIPILGIFPQIKSPIYHYLMNLKDNFGPIFMIKFGMRNTVVMNNFQLIKKSLKDEGDNFSGRWNNKLKTILSSNSGILFIEGEKWLKQRTFILRVLRDFGFGKSRSNEIVQSECKYLLDELYHLEGSKIDFSALIPIYTANIISKFIMDKRFLRTDPKIKCIERAIFEVAKKQNLVQIFHLLFPIMDDSETISKFVLWATSMKRIIDDAMEMFEEERKDHLKGLDLNSEGENMMDSFLIMQHSLRERNGTTESFTDNQLVTLSFELFAAGYETTSTTLDWSMLFMSKNQDIQKKVHDEIIANIGSERLPSMNNKILLIYTQAVMDEIHRMGSVLPLSLFHKTFNDTCIDNFYIPKNTLLFTNLYACHRDPDVWEKPYEFYPEHFLERTDDGSLKYLPREELIPFSIGKRQCLGESLARMEFFIFFVAIMQRFQVRFSDDVTTKQYEEAIQGNEGIIRFSKIKNYIFQKY